MRAPSEHFPSLDGVRGLAVSMVVVFHAAEGWESPNTSWLAGLAFGVARYGSLGVDLFFVLSGFLITGILLESRGQHGYFRSFYARRILRIFPLYYLYLALLGLIVAFVPEARQSYARSWPWYALYLTNLKIVFFNDGDLASVQHLWSLAIEEHFYLLWPALVAIVPRRALLRFALFAAALVVSVRWLWLSTTGDTLAVHMSTWTRADTLLVGAALAIVRSDVRDWNLVVAAAPFVLGGALASFLVAPAVWPESNLVRAGNYTLSALCFASFLALCVAADERGWRLRVLRKAALRRVGAISYGIYVFHFIVTLRFNRILHDWISSGFAGFSLALASISVVSYAVAALSFRFVESPLLQLKRHFPRATILANANLSTGFASECSSADPRCPDTPRSRRPDRGP